MGTIGRSFSILPAPLVLGGRTQTSQFPQSLAGQQGDDIADQSCPMLSALFTLFNPSYCHSLTPLAPSMYHRTMNYINSVLEDAVGQRTVPDSPVAPETDPPPAQGGPINLPR